MPGEQFTFEEHTQCFLQILITWTKSSGCDFHICFSTRTKGSCRPAWVGYCLCSKTLTALTCLSVSQSLPSSCLSTSFKRRSVLIHGLTSFCFVLQSLSASIAFCFVLPTCSRLLLRWLGVEQAFGHPGESTEVDDRLQLVLASPSGDRHPGESREVNDRLLVLASPAGDSHPWESMDWLFISKWLHSELLHRWLVPSIVSRLVALQVGTRHPHHHICIRNELHPLEGP